MFASKNGESGPTNNWATEDLTIFKADDMLIYTYSDGQKMVKADPMVLFKRWSEKEREIEVDLKAAQTPGFDKANEAYDAALNRIRWIFNIKPFEEGGLTEIKTLDLYNHLVMFFIEVKKNSNQSQTSPATSESQSVPLQEKS